MNFTVIGGSNGIGAAVVKKLLKNEKNAISIIDVAEPIVQNERITFLQFDLFKEPVSLLKEILEKTDGLIITSGIGRVCEFYNYSLTEIEKNIKVNLESIAEILFLVKNKLYSKESDFYCLVMNSIAGFVSSPLFSVYSASKAGLLKLIEAINIELIEEGAINRICSVVATTIPGTSFKGGETNLDMLENLADELLDAMKSKETMRFVEKELVEDVIKRYQENPLAFGRQSHQYKIENNRLNPNNPIRIGYLSGTFDLFHIGHLNILRNAKKYCDYLVVGVHKDASHKNKEVFIPFEERCEILKHIDFVDEVMESCKEDSDAWYKIQYDFLFVGSDYKGSERFLKYENFFKDKGTQIVYFPYTKGTSSTQLRMIINKKD